MFVFLMTPLARHNHALAPAKISLLWSCALLALPAARCDAASCLHKRGGLAKPSAARLRNSAFAQNGRYFAHHTCEYAPMALAEKCPMALDCN